MSIPLNRSRVLSRITTLLLGGLLSVISVVVSAEKTVLAPGGVAVGGNVVNSPITIGLTPEQLDDLKKSLQITVKTSLSTDPKAQAKLDALSRELNVTHQALVGFFQILNTQQVPLEKLPQTLAEIAQRHRDMLARLSALESDDPTIQKLRTEARTVIANAKSNADYDRADQLLSQAEDADVAGIKQLEALVQQTQTRINERQLSAAASRAERGELSLTRLDYLQAADHFKAAADLVPKENLTVRTDYRNRYGSALYQYGDEQGDNERLRDAIGVYQDTLKELPRERVPLDWARAQNNLGNALRNLGERETGTAHLEAAVTAFKEALKEHTRERVPLDWARAQNNLGITLWRIGERESGTVHLEAAVEAYRAALKEHTRERVPLDWARAQNNLGLVLQTLGVRESDTVRLEAAVEAYRAALKERTRERVPLQWAVTQYNLGMVLTELGKLQRDKSRLAEAKQAIQQAQGIFRDTSMTQYEDSFKEELEKIDNLLEAIANNKP